MEITKSIRKTVVALSVIAFVAGCGGGSSSSGGTGGASSSSTATEKDALTMQSVRCINPENLEAGRTIRLESTLFSRSTADDNRTVVYFITPDNGDGKRLTYIADDHFVPAAGTSTRELDTILPASLRSGSYRIVAVADTAAFAEKDFNLSAVSKSLYAQSEAVYIQANDGKPDIEAVALHLTPTDGTAAEGRAADEPPVLTFDVGIVDGNVILNSRGISFTGTLHIRDYIAPAHGFRISACVDFGNGCRPVELYSTDENNQTRYDTYMTVASATPKSPKDIIFTGVIRKELLNDLAVATLKNNPLTSSVKVSIGGIEESATQDPAKNSISAAVRFVPLALSEAQIDNTYDKVALALSNYKLSMKTYIDDIKKIDPSYDVPVSSSGLDLFNPNLHWQLNDPIKGIRQQAEDSLQFTDGTLRFKPVSDPKNIEAVKPLVIPAPSGVEPQNDPINDIRPVDKMISNLSIGHGITGALLGADAADLANETVNEKVFSARYDIEEKPWEGAGLKGGIHGEARFDKRGARFSGEAYIDAFVLKEWHQIVGIEAVSATVPENLDETGYRFSLTFLKHNIYHQSRYVTESQNVSNSQATDLHRRIEENLETLKNMEGDLLSYHDWKGWHDHKEDGGTFTVMGVPIAYEYGVEGTMGVRLKLDIKSIGMINAGITPFAEFSGYGKIGPGFNFHGIDVSTGLEGELDLIEDNFVMGGDAGIRFVSDDTGITSFIGELVEVIINNYSPPSGGLYFYASAEGIGVWNKTIWDVESDPSVKVLLNKHQTLFKVDLK